MFFVPTQLHQSRDAHLEAAKAQIARCIEIENKLKAEERRERADQLGIDLNGDEWKHRQRPAT